MVILQILIPIFAIMVMIVVHEFGHYLAGRFFKVPVYEFAIGMGKELYSRQWKETKWSLRLYPIGGYCAFDNMEEIKDKKEGLLDLALERIPKYQKIIICLAGPFMNILLAFVITFFVSMIFSGKSYYPEITKFTDKSVVSKEMSIGDIFVSINDKEIKNSIDVRESLEEYNGGEEVKIVYKKSNGKEYEFQTRPYYDDELKRYMFGVTMDKEKGYELNLIKTFNSSIKETYENSILIYKSIIDIFSGKYKLQDMSGIVGTVGEMGKYVQVEKTVDEKGEDISVGSAWVYFFTFCSLISINLGVFNLFPLPVLDGGKIFITLFESITKIKINQRILTYITIGSFAALILFMIIITGNDVFKMLRT